jgi:hypothetical protein
VPLQLWHTLSSHQRSRVTEAFAFGASLFGFLMAYGPWIDYSQPSFYASLFSIAFNPTFWNIVAQNGQGSSLYPGYQLITTTYTRVHEQIYHEILQRRPEERMLRSRIYDIHAWNDSRLNVSLLHLFAHPSSSKEKTDIHMLSFINLVKKCFLNLTPPCSRLFCSYSDRRLCSRRPGCLASLGLSWEITLASLWITGWKDFLSMFWRIPCMWAALCASWRLLSGAWTLDIASTLGGIYD